jgi:hypothetical protein
VDPATGAGGRWDARAHELGITRLFQSARTDYPGSVYVLLDEPLERRAGFVASNGDAIAEWIGGHRDGRDGPIHVATMLKFGRPDFSVGLLF